MPPINIIRYSLIFLLLAGLKVAPVTAQTQATPQISSIVQLQIQDAIGPATSDYIERSMDKAVESGAKAVLILLDTPGGLDTSMRQIIKKIIASPIPVITYVSPGGARAASAGTYLLYASHVAAMTPGTNLGAATPVQLIPAGNPDEPSGDELDKAKPSGDKSKGETVKNPMMQKALNDAVAYIRSLAEMRGRNADWAERAVRDAASLSAEQALKLKVIDIVAIDRTDLLKQLDNRVIPVLGQNLTLQTKDAEIRLIEPDWRSELLAVITNPNIAYILLLAGIYGLIFEFSNPGSIIPGTIGGICLLLALFAFQVLPVNYAGMALILLGIALMIAEAFVPSIGILGFGGLTAFVIGSVILMDTDAPGFGINIALIGAFALSSAAFLIIALGLLLKARHKSVVTGSEELSGSIGIALDDFSGTGLVRVHSEIWRARTRESLHKNQKIQVNNRDGLILEVSSIPNQENLHV
ncbi:NfeD family protein [Methylicorpusculum sp.]|uniref:NfeD family protein n=1 Tax=Methylicorpusculum sp. TaxID=2713644 RepID=UPI0027313B0C|nr:nodulation protein NfeD [Methylicorpusculum sp.]MDP2180674.1 nodulation protein NfeD [Methylicorpusculum sp.]MDP3529270.1 nodulation protein NfeD [Methylicorpusculum sp.]MDZ4150416.1 nodulation protein NfeD [Methylicorpusculum sp.]